MFQKTLRGTLPVNNKVKTTRSRDGIKASDQRSRLVKTPHIVCYNSSSSSDVETIVEVGPRNSRFVFASILINAPSESAWRALTEYEALGTFIPGLTVNQCLEHRPKGARLLQIGQQNIAMGIKFSARCILDVNEYEAGLPQEYCVTSSLDNATTTTTDNSSSLFPLPRSTSTSRTGLPQECRNRYRDVSFELVEGDFLVFKGLWRVTDLLQGNDDDTSNNNSSIDIDLQQGLGSSKCQVSYTLYVRPHSWLPVGLIQNRIEKEVISNLQAVKKYVEQRQEELLLIPSSNIATESSCEDI